MTQVSNVPNVEFIPGLIFEKCSFEQIHIIGVSSLEEYRDRLAYMEQVFRITSAAFHEGEMIIVFPFSAVKLVKKTKSAFRFFVSDLLQYSNGSCNARAVFQFLIEDSRKETASF